MANYVDPEEFRTEILQSKENNELTRRAVTMLNTGEVLIQKNPNTHLHITRRSSRTVLQKAGENYTL